MITEDQILVELKKINEQLSKQNKGAAKSFVAGFMHSFGSFLGTTAIFIIVALYASRYNWPAMIGKSVETMMSQINWTNIVPTPEIKPHN